MQNYSGSRYWNQTPGQQIALNCRELIHQLPASQQQHRVVVEI